MIVHDPSGIDDPYKSTPSERFPRYPRPDDAVQVNFRVPHGAAAAWAEVTHATPGAPAVTKRVDARRGVGDTWSVDLGTAAAGTVRYTLFAQPAAGVGANTQAGPFSYDLGVWREVTGISSYSARPGGVEFTLNTTHAPAYLTLTFPTRGACRLSLARATTSSPPQSGDGPAVEDTGAAFTVSSQGMRLVLDKRSLVVTATLEGASEPVFHGSLATRWLERGNDQPTSVEFSFQTQEGEALYGLGERFVNADRNGERWDVRVYEEYKEQGKRTYIPVPFLVSERGYGLWLDAAEPSDFDLRTSEAKVSLDRMTLGPDGAPRSLLELVIFVADQPYGVTAAFTRLTGAAAVPPAWAFGPWMSSNSWNSQERVTQEVDRTLAEGVPASVVVIEAWSDEATFYIFNDAEYDPKPGGEALALSDFRFTGRWPDPQAFIDHCHANGVRVVLWQIPVHKLVTEPHAQHDADGAYMIDRGLGIMQADGSPYRNKGWWFTDALIADFSNPETREWWFAKRRYLFDELGIDGMKTDGGEHLWGRDLRSFDGRRGLELFNTYANDYVGAYHEFVQLASGGDGVTFSRASYTGAQRHPIHWAGDEDSTWSAYRASVKAGLSAGVSGVSLWSWDLAGFSGEIPPVELYVRSTAMATFSPIMQYHSEGHGAADNRDRTPWNIAARHGDERALSVYRAYAQLRMRLVDYLHAEALAAAELGVPLMRYPALEFPEAHEFLAADEYAYLLGRDLLVAPITEKGCGTREVRLPPGRWVDLWSGSELEGGRIFNAAAPLEVIPVFVRAGSARLDLLLRAVAEFRPQVAG